VIKSGKLIKHVAKSLGDTPIDISTAPQGNVRIVHTVTNDGETNRHCAELVPHGCAHKMIAAGTGYKLVCRIDIANPSCTASASGAFID
jgi:hypothetical protein